MTTIPNQTSATPRLFRDILQVTSLYSIALVAPRFVGVLLLPIMTRSLAPADYGVLDLLEHMGSVIAVLLGARFSSALGYFYTEATSDAGRRAAVGTTVLGAAALGTVGAAICWPFAGVLGRTVFGNASDGFYLRLVFAALPLAFALEALLTWARVADRPKVFLAASAIRVATNAAGIIGFVAVLHLRVWGVLWTTLIATLASIVFLAPRWLRESPPRFELRLFRRMAAYALPLALGAIAMFIIHFGDRFILPRYRSFGELGIYALGYKIGMLITLVSGAFDVYWTAQVFQVMRRDDAKAVFGRLFTYVAAILCFCGIGLIVFARPALRLLAPPAYAGAAAVVPLIVAAYVVRALGDFFKALFLAQGRPAYDAICNGMAAGISLAGYALLIPRYGMWGAAAATAAAFAAMAAIAVVWTYRLRPYRLETGRLVKIAAASGVALAVHRLAPAASSLAIEVIAAAVSLAIFPVALWILRVPTAGEWNRAKAAAARVAGA